MRAFLLEKKMITDEKTISQTIVIERVSNGYVVRDEHQNSMRINRILVVFNQTAELAAWLCKNFQLSEAKNTDGVEK